MTQICIEWFRQMWVTETLFTTYYMCLNVVRYVTVLCLDWTLLQWKWKMKNEKGFKSKLNQY